MTERNVNIADKGQEPASVQNADTPVQEGAKPKSRRRRGKPQPQTSRSERNARNGLPFVEGIVYLGIDRNDVINLNKLGGPSKSGGTMYDQRNGQKVLSEDGDYIRTDKDLDGLEVVGIVPKYYGHRSVVNIENGDFVFRFQDGRIVRFRQYGRRLREFSGIVDWVDPVHPSESYMGMNHPKQPLLTGIQGKKPVLVKVTNYDGDKTTAIEGLKFMGPQPGDGDLPMRIMFIETPTKANMGDMTKPRVLKAFPLIIPEIIWEAGVDALWHLDTTLYEESQELPAKGHLKTYQTEGITLHLKNGGRRHINFVTVIPMSRSVAEKVGVPFDDKKARIQTYEVVNKSLLPYKLPKTPRGDRIIPNSADYASVQDMRRAQTYHWILDCMKSKAFDRSVADAKKALKIYYYTTEWVEAFDAIMGCDMDGYNDSQLITKELKKKYEFQHMMIDNCRDHKRLQDTMASGPVGQGAKTSALTFFMVHFGRCTRDVAY